KVLPTAILYHRLLRKIASLSLHSMEYKNGSNDVTIEENKDYKSIGEKIKEKKRSLSALSPLLLFQQKASTQNKEKGFLLLLGSTLFFYISATMIFGPYTPFLKENGITDAEVFIATAVLHLSKIALL